MTSTSDVAINPSAPENPPTPTIKHLVLSDDPAFTPSFESVTWFSNSSPSRRVRSHPRRYERFRSRRRLGSIARGSPRTSTVHRSKSPRLLTLVQPARGNSRHTFQIAVSI